MALEITQHELENVLVCDLKGTIVLGDSASAVRTLVKDLLAGGHKRAVFNLKQVDFIDSSGLGVLILAHSTIQTAGGGLKLANLSRRSMELLVLTKLSTVFEVFADEQDAVNSFFPNREIKRFDILDFVKRK
jgi:anti-sigma B factor antagonist